MFLLQAGFSPVDVLGIVWNLPLSGLTIIVVLALFSVFSWAVIIDRLWLLRKAERQGRKFLDTFHGSSKFSQVRKAAQDLDASPLSGMFLAGYREISSQVESTRQRDEGAPAPQIDLETLERSMIKAGHEERRGLQRGMLFLATTSSVSPFIGLLGTVWGIMSAFHSIGQFGTANLAVVAPGISEALITTVAGLAAAIPALIAYNHLLSRIRALTGDMEDFGLEFLNVVKKTWQGAGR